eukprot:symbB.v1.2.021732.t1/scaffold1896.1/size96813/3
MADPQSLNKVSAESSWHNTVAGRQARRELFHQPRSRHKHTHADAATYADAESANGTEPMSSLSASSTAPGSASSRHSPGQGLRAQDLASSLTELANFVAQSQRENLPAGVPVPAEASALQSLLEQVAQQNLLKAGLPSVPERQWQHPTVEQAAAWPCPAGPINGQRHVPPEVTGSHAGKGLQAEVPPSVQLAKLAEIFRLLGQHDQVRATMPEQSLTSEQQTLLSHFACEQVDKWLQEQRTQLQQLRQMQQLQQMQRQMQELQPKLQQMQEMVNRFMNVAYVAQQVPQLQSSQQATAMASMPSMPAYVPAPGLDWPPGMPDPGCPSPLESLASYGHMGMPGAAGNLAAGHDKIPSNGNMDMKHAARAQNRANHVQKKKGWLNSENEEAAQSSSPPSSCAEKASLHADKKSTLGMHLTQLQTEDPKCVFIARRINGMGFQSKDVLSAHYEQYGRVVKVLVAHSKVKPFRRQGAQSRIRPGSLGFIVMDSPQSVEKILAHGANQTVAGHNISVERFEKIAKPQENVQSTAGDSTTTHGSSTTTGSGSGSGGDSNGSDKSSAAGANGMGESGSGGSEEGSDKGNGFSNDGSQQKAEGSSEDSNGGDGGDGDWQSESSNRATSPGTGRKKEAFEEGVLPGDSEKTDS